MKKIMCNLFEITFSLVFISLYVGLFFYDISLHHDVNPWVSLISSIFFLLSWFILYKKILRNANNWSLKKEIIITLSIFSIFILLQIIVLRYLRVSLAWDPYIILNNAEIYAIHGKRLLPGIDSWLFSYLQYYQHNIPIFFIYLGIVKVANFLEIADTWFLILLFNMFVILLTIVILYLFLRKKFNKRSACFGLLISLCFLPLILYTTLCYSDTLSLPFVILLPYLYLFLDSSNTAIKKFFMSILMALTVFIGMKIKMTVLIVFIAILIDIVLHKKTKLFLIQLTSFIIIFILLTQLYNTYILNNPKYAFNLAPEKSFPITHWIMMGIEDPEIETPTPLSVGGYNANDLNKTLNCNNSDEAKKVNIAEFKRRLSKYSLSTYLEFLLKKAVNCWGDGTYYSSEHIIPQSITLKPEQTFINISTFLSSIVGINEPNYNYYLYFSQGVQLAFLVCLITTSIFSIIKQNFDTSFIRISIFGIMLFLLIWENNSRYLLNFIPLFIIIIVEQFYKLKEN